MTFGPELVVIPFGLLFVGSFVVWIWALVDAIQVPDDSMYRSGTKLMGAGDRADPGRRSDHLLRHWQAGPAGCALGSADPSPASSPDALLRVSPPGDAKRLERPYTRGVRKEGEDP
ncbi:MAG TPA: hypothetical protein VEN95_06890 [Actinomycetota bacterium]|nr:hypothetical protein [Actinomycetota bacterium]